MRNLSQAVLSAFLAACLFCPSLCRAAEARAPLNLESVIEFALKHNPRVRIAQKDILTEKYGVDSARADMWPKVDFGTGATTYRYPEPLTPVVITLPLQNLDCPTSSRPSTTWAPPSGFPSTEGEGSCAESASHR